MTSHLPRVVAGGEAEKCGLIGQDKVMAINRRAPTSVEEAVHIIKEAGDHLVLVIGRRETRNGRRTGKESGESTNRPQTTRGRSRDRNSSGSTRTVSKSPSRQLLQQAMAGARSQKQRSSSIPRSQQHNNIVTSPFSGFK